MTGSVQVDGLKSDKKKFEEVEKYFKLKEYGNAKRTLDQIIANDEFNIEANCKWIYAVIKLFNITEDDLKNKNIIGEKPEAWQYIKQILAKLERLTITVNNNERDIYLKDFSSLLDVMKKHTQKGYFIFLNNLDSAV